MDGSEKSFTVDNHIKQRHICCLISTKRSIGLLPTIRIRRLLQAGLCDLHPVIWKCFGFGVGTRRVMEDGVRPEIS